MVALVGCGSITLPAAVQMPDGMALVGTTTASISGGSFTVSSADNTVTCSGTYDAFDTKPTIMVPVSCSNGIVATAIITRSMSGMSGVGSAILPDGRTARIAFGNSAGSVLVQPLTQANGLDPRSASIGSFPSTASSNLSRSNGVVNSGNCPTPDSLDSAGRRCGARSAASRPGGYTPYSSVLSSGGSTYVRGHYRNGRYVRPHSRRR